MPKLFEIIPDEVIKKLKQYQRDVHGKGLELPEEPKQKPQEIPVEPEMDLEEIAGFMAEAPHHQKRVA